MTRLAATVTSCAFFAWQPGDGTRYEFLITASSPAGDRFFHWLNGRSSRKGQEPLIARISRFSVPSVATLKRSMKLLEYDAVQLHAFLVELGYPHLSSSEEP